jgi:SAM-dependent methyltransferase
VRIVARRSEKPYVRFAQIYDQVMADVPYRLWMEYIASVWAAFSFSPTSVLDLACGTGSMSLLLARSGFLVTGVDFSPTMLEVAKRKLAAANLYARFVEGDMRDFTLDEPVDAAICMFDSVNYLLEPDQVKSAFRAIERALRPGGLFVFDANTPHRLAMIKKEVHLFEGSDHYLIWSDFWDPSRKWWRVRLTGFVKPRKAEAVAAAGTSTAPPADAWIRFDEVHRERAFPVADVSAWLKEAGFEVLGVYESCSFRPVSEETSRAYFVAKKAVTSGEVPR